MIGRARARFLGGLGACSLALLGCGTLLGCGGEGPTPSSTPSLIRACVRTAACGYQAYPRVADCARSVSLSSALQVDRYRCADGATSCAAVGTCFGDQGACDSSYQATCSSGTAQFCDLMDKRVYTQRCGAFGLDCKLDATYRWAAGCQGSGQAAQPLEAGVDGAGEVCVRTGEACGQTLSENDRCSGEQLLSCLEGQWVRFDCAGLGLGPCRTSGDTPATTWGHCGKPSS